MFIKGDKLFVRGNKAIKGSYLPIKRKTVVFLEYRNHVPGTIMVTCPSDGMNWWVYEDDVYKVQKYSTNKEASSLLLQKEE
jgi:hypothetical protein